MILCRQPIRIYDVDAAGLAGLVLLIALGVWQLPAQWRQVAHEYQKRGALYQGTERQLRAELPAVAEAERRIRDAVATLRARQDSAPSTRALPELLSELTEMVRSASLDLVRFTPQPAKREGPYDVCEIEFAARGTLTDFIRFLDLLAKDQASHELYTCTISRGANGKCELGWKLRLYLLPPPGTRSDDAGGSQ